MQFQTLDGVTNIVKRIARPLRLFQRNLAVRRYNRITQNGRLVHFDTKLFIREQYRLTFGRYPDLTNPMTYNEKLQWLKLYWRDPLAQQCVDKYGVRDYIISHVGEKYVPELYGVWNDPNAIDWQILPERFVLKSTHASGHVIVCRRKDQCDTQSCLQRMREWLNVDYFAVAGEWPYRNLPRRIICEELIGADNAMLPRDFKIMCFNGRPKLIFVVSDRENTLKVDFFDFDWNLLPFTRNHPNSSRQQQKPTLLKQMLDIAAQLSAPFPHVRVDFYYEQGRLLVGELTFFPGGGLEPFSPNIYDRIVGSYLTLPPRNR